MGFFYILLLFIVQLTVFTCGLRTIFFHPSNQTVNPSLKGMLPDTKQFDYNYRLSDDIIPIEYEIYLTFKISSNLVNGYETITVMPTKDTKILTLHLNKKYVFVTVALIQDDDQLYILKKPFYNHRRLTLTYDMPIKLKQNVYYRIQFEFKTKANMGPQGILSHNVDDNKVFYTKFEMLGARRAFPCFDEPQFKAQYQLNVTIIGDPGHSSYIPLSNSMSVKKGTTMYFYKTLKMSSYLLSIVVGPYKPICTSHGPQIQCGKPGVPGLSQKVCQYLPESKFNEILWFSEASKLNKFSLDAYCKIQTYFRVDSPAQLHFAWVPSGGIATEHWGLVSVPIVLNQTKLFAHEISHYWFGDLVSPETWAHLWLNEGFADYMTYSSDVIFSPDSRDRVEKAQASADSITDGPDSPTVVDNLWANDFGTPGLFVMNYVKGSLIALMTECILGKERFRKALHNYMKAKAYGNANTDELLTAFKRVSDHTVNIARVLERFLTYGGKPNLKIAYNKSQHLFNVHKDVPSGTAEDWIVPLWAYDISRNISTINWIKDETTIIELSNITTSGNPSNIKWNYYHFAYYTFQIAN